MDDQTVFRLGYRPQTVMATVAVLMLLGSVSALTAPVTTSHSNHVAPLDPLVIAAENSRRTPIGLVYSPQLLQQLLDRGINGVPDSRIVKAVREQTPIVVMWDISVPAEAAPTPHPPWKLVIIPGEGLYSPDRVSALWLDQDATQLAKLDDHIRVGEVAAMGAFPGEAVTSANRICLLAEYPPDFDKKSGRTIDRCGRIVLTAPQK